MEQKAYNITNFCKAFDISRSLLYRLWDKGQGPKRARLGGRVVITSEEAKAWIEKHQMAEKAHT